MERRGESPTGPAPLFAILTLFPEALEAYLGAGIVGLARERGLVEVRCIDFRDFARDRNRTVDDRPFGGGPGMVLRPEPIVECVEWLEQREGPFRKLLLCPAGRPFDQLQATKLSTQALTGTRVMLLCGRYEGFDERIQALLGFEAVSIGDYVLSGGELGALVIAEACIRLLPGALGDDRSAVEDSFAGELLDHPHYTRPRSFRGLDVPEVLLDGNHARIAEWRKSMALQRTKARRPDLLRTAESRSSRTQPNERPSAAREPTESGESGPTESRE